MDRPDFESTRALLLAAEDSQIARLVRLFDAVFRSRKYRPAEDTPERERDLVAAVRAVFPTPFARTFLGWCDAEAEYREALARAAEPGLDPEQRDRARLAATRHLRNAILEMWTCWLQIVHFLPFILMAGLRRFDDEALKQHAGKELAHALYYYRTFYEKAQDERRREADQLHLLVSLNKLLRRVSAKGLLGEDFVLAALAPGEPDAYPQIFPERFDACMRLLLQARNVVVHGHVETRPAEVTEPVYALMKWCFLEVIAVLAPICRGFGLSYVTGLELSAGEAGYAEVEALDFSAIDGPSEARYRVSSSPQLDDYAFVDLRLYLIARQRRMGAGSGELLEPRDYLDLTPFVITDSLRIRAAEQGAPPEVQRRALYALQRYFEPMQELLFSELGGSHERTLSSAGATAGATTGEDWEARLLLETIDRFKARASRLAAQIDMTRGGPANPATVRSQLWLISREHLAPLLDTRRYDEHGERSREAGSGLKAVYEEALFVEPPESEQIRGFLKADRRGLLIVGGSGFGKSNLLVHHYLAHLRAGGLGVFLSARQFDTASFREALTEKLARQVALEWTSLAALDGFLDEQGESLTIFVDALNEFSGSHGPLPLLADLIATTGSEAALRRCRIVASCRSETWQRYAQQHSGGQPLDPEVFQAPNGQPLRLTGFEKAELRAALYDAYRRRYILRPDSYRELSEPVRALIAQPFLMALVAETCAGSDESPGRVPADLDFFSLFKDLTERKTADARILVPASDILGREQMPEAIAELCVNLARLVYERLMSDDPALARAANREALPLDLIDKSYELQPYVRGAGPVSALEAALQVGLLERIAVPQRDREGRLVSSGALTFFHDQYTQYWLASAYQQGLLGWLDPEALGDPAALEALAGKVEAIVLRAVEAPILAGALDHWLQKNLEIFHEGRLEPVIPLLDRLAASDSAAVRFEAVALVTHLILRRALTPKSVYEAVFKQGSAGLRLALVGAFVDHWPSLPPEAARAFIDACDPERDQEPLERLGDVFALQLRLDPEGVAAYLGEAISPLTLGSLVEPRRVLRQFKVSLQFAIFAMMTCFDRPEALAAVRGFFRAKYRPVVDYLSSTKAPESLAGAALRQLRGFLFGRFDAFGVAQWNKFIGSMTQSGNDRFFVECDGVVQREVLAEFLPYMVELHNGNPAALSLAPDSPFRALMLRMLDYKVMSIIGYNATLCLPSVLIRNDWAETKGFIVELIERRTPSALFYGNLLLANLSYTDPGCAGPALRLMEERIVPLLLDEGHDFDWSIVFCIAALDVEQHWPTFERILSRLFGTFEAEEDLSACIAFGDVLYKACYCHDLTLGRRVIELVLRERERFLGPKWQDCTLKLFAAMLTRSPATLRAALLAEGLDESLLRKARDFQDLEIVKQSRLFAFQVDLNRFLAWLYVAEPRLRHPVVKHFIGGLAAGNGIEDFAAGVRQTLIAFIAVFFGEHPEDVPQGRLSVAEIEASVAAARGGRQSAADPAPEPRAAGDEAPRAID